MGRLFWKIFLWFWITLLLISASVFVGTSLYLQSQKDDDRKKYRPRYQVQALSLVIKFSGENAARALIENRAKKELTGKRSSRRLVYVFDKDNKEILNRPVNENGLDKRGQIVVTAPNGEKYRVASAARTKLSFGNQTTASFYRFFKRTFEGVFLLWAGIALVLSSLVCFWLAWYLTRPIRKLQRAAQQLAEGELDTRVSQQIGNRRDEIADLGKDFDNMASRLQRLINNQKQLLSDVSHELRSPLARLQVAIGLAQKKSNKEIKTDLLRIENEAERLDDLVGKSLTLSRLDSGADYPKDDYVDVEALLSKIISDCDFEASEQQKRVSFDCAQTWTINANAELLHRALENIIRNAVNYTRPATTVQVVLGANPDNSQELLISICDQGLGVPEEKMAQLFEPFVRLSSARDRDSGGYGLGLAIAKRAINFHQGEIVAKNKNTQGLCVEVSLPITPIVTRRSS